MKLRLSGFSGWSRLAIVAGIGWVLAANIVQHVGDDLGWPVIAVRGLKDALYVMLGERWWPSVIVGALGVAAFVFSVRWVWQGFGPRRAHIRPEMLILLLLLGAAVAGMLQIDASLRALRGTIQDSMPRTGEIEEKLGEISDSVGLR